MNIKRHLRISLSRNRRKSLRTKCWAERNRHSKHGTHTSDGVLRGKFKRSCFSLNTRMHCNSSRAGITTTLHNFAQSKRGPSHPLVLILRSTTGSYSTPATIMSMNLLLYSLRTRHYTKCRRTSSRCCGNREKTAHWSLQKNYEHILYRFYSRRA